MIVLANCWIVDPGSPQCRALQKVDAQSVGPPLDPSLRITLQFHPDRLYRGRPMLESLKQDGVYRSQFETGTSNGGLTAHVGGDRWKWESRIFGGAYDATVPGERPKYGALNFRQQPTGGAPRFGSSYFRLKKSVSRRTTFCHPDSVFEPRDFGTERHMSLISRAECDSRDQLDNYIEAHVHGPVTLECDVEALVLDPSFRGSAIEDQARLLPCPVEWHPGFMLTVEVLTRNSEYRGDYVVQIGKEISRNNLLTPSILGEAVASGSHDPQVIKKVWHYIARFGDRSHTPHHPVREVCGE